MKLLESIKKELQTLPPASSASEAYNWYAERYEYIYLSRNRWLVAFLLAMGLCILLTIALIFLMPLKTAVPFLIKEELSGAVTTVQRLDDKVPYAPSEPIKKYFLGKYVRARETYDPTDLEMNYRTVDLMSDSLETRAFQEQVSKRNPQSPLMRYADHTKRSIAIKSISFLKEDTAQVRFSAEEKPATGASKVSHWVAVLSFRFGGVPYYEAERLINPIGFLVTSYRVDEEVL